MRKKIIVTIVVLAVLSALGWGGYRRFFSKKTSAEAAVQTVAVQKGTITASLSAVGGIASPRQFDLTFQASGRLVKLEVREGQKVEAGQVLARLDTTQLEIAVAKAKASLASAETSLAKVKAGATAAELASAQASLASAEENLAKVKAGATAAELASAQASLASAEENRAKVKAGPTKEQIAAAEAALEAAQENYQKLLTGPTDSDITVAKGKLEQARLSLERAKNSLWSAQANRDAVLGRPGTPQYQIDSANASVNQAELSLQAARLDYERAQIEYGLQTEGATASDLASALSQVSKARDSLNQLKSQPTAAELAAAEAQVAQARSQLEKLKASPTAAELKSAEAQVAQARSQLEKLKASPTTEDLAIAQTQVEQAKLSLREAELRLQDAQIVAPFSGTVISVPAEEGQMVAATKVILTLADLSKLQIKLAMDEIDVSQVKVGQQAMLTLDALPNLRSIQGQVERVAMAGITTQGVVNYQVLVSVDKPDPALKLAMTANVRIITAQKQGVLVVPHRAIKRSGRQAMVEVMRDGKPVQVPVTIGLAGEDTSEVVSGLAEGDLVVIPTTSTSGARGPTGGMGMPGIGGGMIIKSWK